MSVDSSFPGFHNRSRVMVFSIVLLAMGALCVGSASAQYDFPRLGLSAAPDAYIGRMNAQLGDTFTVYMGAYGRPSGLALGEAMVSLSWAVYQVCCGAALDIVGYEFVGDFVSRGHPLAGVSSVAPECVSGDFIPLAVLQVVLHALGAISRHFREFGNQFLIRSIHIVLPSFYETLFLHHVRIRQAFSAIDAKPQRRTSHGAHEPFTIKISRTAAACQRLPAIFCQSSPSGVRFPRPCRPSLPADLPFVELALGKPPFEHE